MPHSVTYSGLKPHIHQKFLLRREHSQKLGKPQLLVACDLVLKRKFSDSHHLLSTLDLRIGCIDML